MSFLQRLLVSAFIAALVYLTIWRIVIFYFRYNVYKLIFYYSWVKIAQNVNRFVLVQPEGNEKKPTLYLLNDKKENITLENVPEEYIRRILKQVELFHIYEVSKTRCEIVPSSYFMQISESLIEVLTSTSKKLREKLDYYPNFVKFQLDGAIKVLNIIDCEGEK